MVTPAVFHQHSCGAPVFHHHPLHLTPGDHPGASLPGDLQELPAVPLDSVGAAQLAAATVQAALIVPHLGHGLRLQTEILKDRK